MMGTGEASGEGRALKAAEAAIANSSSRRSVNEGCQGRCLVSISGGLDMTLFEVDEAATRIREEVYEDADIVVGAYSTEPRRYIQSVRRCNRLDRGAGSDDVHAGAESRNCPGRSATDVTIGRPLRISAATLSATFGPGRECRAPR